YVELKAIAADAIAIFTWNINYGIFPNYYYQYSHQQEVMVHLQQHPQALFISSDDAQLLNELYYHTGQEDFENVVKSPSLMALKQLPLDSLHALIETYQNNGRKVFTDCLQKPKVQNRASMVIADVDSVFFAPYTQVPADTFTTFYGNRYLFQIK
ncbi:MAG: hypothetical protein LPJ89_09965, partial [Hymenobacteraceae bacterium]|nr:hypothetical protein [Hymenobacteraceae bacterium]